jgi:16S rRNA (cytosine967-C5)-methyltransferase
MAGTGARTRAVAAEVIDAVVSGGRSLDAAIAAAEMRLPADERPLMRMLAFGTLRNHFRLQEWVNELVSRPLKSKDRVINALLAAGLFQLCDTRIPEHAAVSLTVDAARALRRPKLAGLLNACLRRFQREGLATREARSEEARHNHAQWFIDQVRHDWPEDWEAILAANNKRAPMWLRVNTARAPAAEYLERLHGAGIEATPSELLPDALCLDEPRPVTDLPGFAEGAASVQDAAAQLAGRWLMSRQPSRVLDACAAPGGKSGHLLELGGDDFELTALDVDENRLVRVRENHERLGLSATIRRGDASTPQDWWDGKPYDAILLDAPCSATGVIRRHPDIKLLRRAADIGELAVLQGSLLGALWGLLAPGGRLLYVTCSVLATENDAVVGRFIEANEDAVEDAVLPNYNIRDVMRRKACGYQVLPGTADMDGFFYACLVKNKS